MLAMGICPYRLREADHSIPGLLVLRAGRNYGRALLFIAAIQALALCVEHIHDV
jgi:hypothetical protein